MRFFLPALMALAFASCSHAPNPEAASSGLGRAEENFTIDESSCRISEEGKFPLSRDEYLCHAAKRFAALNKRHSDFLTKEELANAGNWKKTADANGDQLVSLLEFMREAERDFDAADANHDGQLSGTEYRHARLKLP